MQYRRDIGDMIETYKFTHGKYTSNYPFTNDEDISRRGQFEVEERTVSHKRQEALLL